ncbi:MAG: hypothetical protein CL610_08335 [Anaerolineaceae bacterium]|nr:hypothetical protein [Anaerolineaceae bacterium]
MTEDMREIEGVKKTLLVPSTDFAPKNTEGSMIHLQNGDILFLWTQFVDIDQLPEAERPPFSGKRRAPTSDDGYARVMGMTSTDGGFTWSEPRVYVDDADAEINCMSPALTRMADGRLLLAYSWRSGGNHVDNHGPCAKRVRISDDEGETWSEPVQITPQDGLYYTGCHDRAYTLPSGRVLVQCHTLHPGPAKKMSNFVAYSDDNGSTWQLSNFVTEPIARGFEEASISRRNDGSLLMIMRSWRGHAYYTESFNDGASWSEAYSAGVVAPAAPSLLANLPDSDNLLLIWNPVYIPDVPHNLTRHPLLCAISNDQGRSWGPPKALEVSPDYQWAYPGILFHDGMALVHYYRSHVARNGCREMVLAHVPINWFYDEFAT